MIPPNYREREIMQRLRGADWVKAAALPKPADDLGNLVSKGWVEKDQSENGMVYRLTNMGLEGPVRIR